MKLLEYSGLDTTRVRAAYAKVCEALGTATNGIYERNQECAEAIRRGE